jgi:HK97 family phage major capsid protein
MTTSQLSIAQMNLEPDFHAPPYVQAGIAATLANYYRELAGTTKPVPRFSFGRYLRALSVSRPVDGYEREVLSAAALSQSQEFDQRRAVVPWGCFASRSMGATPGSKGGFLSGAETAQAVDVLRPWSVTAEAGVQIITGLRTGSLTIPNTTTAPAAGWIGEFGTLSESPPSLGNVSLVPRTGACFVKFSAQLLKQAPEAVEVYLRQLLLQAAGALLDAAVLNGAGGSAPLGLTGTPGVGSQSGTSLALAGLLAMKGTILAAGGRADRLAWIAPPATAELLESRERVVAGGRHLWDNDSVLGRPAYVSTTAPTGRLIVGDFSTCVVAHWGQGIQIDVDPSQDFESAGLVARVLLFADVGFPTPGAFAISTTVT